MPTAKAGALRYIEWGEQQVYRTGTHTGLRWCENPWIKDRQPGWWAVPTYRTRPGQIFLIRAYGDRFVVRFSPVPLIADTRLFFLSPYSQDMVELIAAVMNSTVVALLMEVVGRVTLGDGAMEIAVDDARDYLLVPDIRQFSHDDAEVIKSAFKPLLKRPVESIFKEVLSQDRRELDATVLTAMNLAPHNYLQPIYDGLCQLVRDRLNLAAQRKKAQKTRPQRDVRNAKEAVIQELMPSGPKRFPDDFINYDLIGDKYTQVKLPGESLRVSSQFFGAQEVTSERGFSYKARTPPEAKFVVYAQASGISEARIPQEPLEQFKAVSAYEVYLRKLRVELLEALRSRTMNQKIAVRLLDDIWQEYRLPSISEST